MSPAPLGVSAGSLGSPGLQEFFQDCCALSDRQEWFVEALWDRHYASEGAGFPSVWVPAGGSQDKGGVVEADGGKRNQRRGFPCWQNSP